MLLMGPGLSARIRCTAPIVRPSGTEPKVKVYILANGVTKAECDEKVAKYAAWAETLKG